MNFKSSFSTTGLKSVANSRIIMRIEVETESKDQLDAFCERTGMTKVAAASRLIDWFAKQPDIIQAVVQGLFPASIEADVAAIVLKRLAAQRKSKPNPLNMTDGVSNAKRLCHPLGIPRK